MLSYLASFTLYSYLLLLHPVHISVTEVNYVEKSRAFQITSRIFIDDLELAIRARRKEPELDIIQPRNGMTTDQLVSDYLKDHFIIKLDGKPAKMNYLGSEKEDFAIICYLEIEGVKKIKTLEAFNSVITEIHDDQSNLVHVVYKSPVKSVRLTLHNLRETFNFEKK